jgi:hypothetical protein
MQATCEPNPESVPRASMGADIVGADFHPAFVLMLQIATSNNQSCFLQVFEVPDPATTT